jgi:hypothetical protein
VSDDTARPAPAHGGFWSPGASEAAGTVDERPIPGRQRREASLAEHADSGVEDGQFQQHIGSTDGRTLPPIWRSAGGTNR